MLAISSALLGAIALYEPHRISYAALADGGRFSSDGAMTLKKALSSSGIVQVTEVPGYGPGREAVLTQAAMCGDWSQTHTFDDSTTRRTMATHTIPGPGGAQPFLSSAPSSTSACAELEAVAAPFRAAVDGAVRLFGDRLGSLLNVEAPLLATRSGFPFADMGDVVDNGEHLEHIHAYTKVGEPLEEEDESASGATLEMHTDQGLFIAFTPALVVTPSASTGGAFAPAAEADASRFHLRLPGGEVVRAQFDKDALVFMIGQGVENVVKPKLLASKPGSFAPFVPRATPHALSVRPSSSSSSSSSLSLRMWYGRMVLPPADATLEGTAKTYGELRDSMNTQVASGASSSVAVALGCSAGGARARSADQLALTSLHRRVLSEPASCANGTGLQCWHRCMPLADGNNEDSSAVDCAAQNLLLQCVNSRDQIAPNLHGDYYPACTNTTTQETPLPPLDTSSRAGCAPIEEESAFVAHVDAVQVSEGYVAKLNLTSMCGASGWGPNAIPGYPCLKGALLYTTAANGAVHAKMIVNAAFGWIALGLANPGGDHNGMNGGRIVMALPGNPVTYSAATGLDLTSGPAVNEYIINENGQIGSAFRLWDTPYPTPSLSAASFERTDCYTSMSFTTTAISGWELNTSGTDQLIWGLNEADAFVGYHSSANRGLLHVDWTDGAPSASDNHHTDETPKQPVGTAGVVIIGAAAAIFGLVVGAFIAWVMMSDKSAAPTPVKVEKSAVVDTKSASYA